MAFGQERAYPQVEAGLRCSPLPRGPPRVFFLQSVNRGKVGGGFYAAMTSRPRGVELEVLDRAVRPGEGGMIGLTYDLFKARKEGGDMLTSHQRPVAQGRVCAGDMSSWPSRWTTARPLRASSGRG